MHELMRLLEMSGPEKTSAAVRAAFDTLFDAAPFGLAILGLDLRVVMSNPAFTSVVDDATLARIVVVAGEARDRSAVCSREVAPSLRVHCHPFGLGGHKLGVCCAFEPDRVEIPAAWFERPLLAALSHELRAPSATIDVWTRALADNPTDGDLLARAVSAIRESVTEQTRLLEELSRLAQAADDQPTCPARWMDADRELDAALEHARGRAAVRAVRIEKHSAPALGLLVGHVPLRHGLSHLLAAAIRSAPPGGSVVVTASRRSGLEITVSWTVHRNPRTSRVGTKIEVALARALIDENGGTVAEIETGAGRSFLVQLPIASPEPTVAEHDNDADAIESSSGARVLLVDDDRDMLEGLAFLLGGKGIAVDTAFSFTSAWKLLQRGSHEVVVSDLRMHDGDGYSFVRKLRGDARTADLYAIALTGLASSEDRSRALAAGFDIHMTKPVDVDALAAKLARRPILTRAQLGR